MNRLAFRIRLRRRRAAGSGLLTTLLLLAAAAPAAAQSKPVAPAPNAAAGKARKVELILDASGSMNAKTKDGTRRIDAAKQAVKALSGAIPPDVEVALRAYGHQSPREKKDCDDIELLSGFAPAKDSAGVIASKAAALSAKGYTPISRSLKLAAADFPKDGAPHSIVLVSDGKETCDADPCAEAKRLVAGDAGLVIHTVGFDVDAATRTQLSCIARVTGGRYFEAEDAGGLAAVIGKAAVEQKIDIKPPKGDGLGTLGVTQQDPAGHKVFDADGKLVGVLNAGRGRLRLPGGIYSVVFGASRWSGVEVQPKKETMLTGGVLEIVDPWLFYKVVDMETGETHCTITRVKDKCTLLPGTYEVALGEYLWKDIRVETGKTSRIVPGRIALSKVGPTAMIYGPDGERITQMHAMQMKVPVPAGVPLTVVMGGKRIQVTVAEGETHVLE